MGALLEAGGSAVIMVGDPSLGPPPDTVALDVLTFPGHFVSEDRLLASGGPILDLSRKPASIAGRLEDVGVMPAVSPDGRWMAHVLSRDATGRFEVVLEPFPDGGGASRLRRPGGKSPRGCRVRNSSFGLVVRATRFR